jgi:hypothetical protein
VSAVGGRGRLLPLLVQATPSFAHRIVQLLLFSRFFSSARSDTSKNIYHKHQIQSEEKKKEEKKEENIENYSNLIKKIHT